MKGGLYLAGLAEVLSTESFYLVVELKVRRMGKDGSFTAYYMINFAVPREKIWRSPSDSDRYQYRMGPAAGPRHTETNVLRWVMSVGSCIIFDITLASAV